MNEDETLDDIIEEMKEREDLDGGKDCDNFNLEYGEFGGFDGLKLLHWYADRL